MITTNTDNNFNYNNNNNNNKNNNQRIKGLNVDKTYTDLGFVQADDIKHTQVKRKTLGLSEGNNMC